MVLILFLSIFLAISAEQSENQNHWAEDAYHQIMQEYENGLNTGSYKSAQALYQKQLTVTPALTADQVVPFNEILQEVNGVTGQALSITKPIIYNSILEAKTNPKGEYYVWNFTTNVWHLPQQAAPVEPVDGAAINARKLSKKIQDSVTRSLSPINPEIQKRGFSVRLPPASGFSSAAKSIKKPPPKWYSYKGLKLSFLLSCANFVKPPIVKYTFAFFGGLGFIFLLVDAFSKMRGQSANRALSRQDGYDYSAGTDQLYDYETDVYYPSSNGGFYGN